MSVTVRNPGARRGAKIISYRYDGLGRRICKEAAKKPDFKFFLETKAHANRSESGLL